ncbi:MAG: hypothetical protein H7175_20305 [Burkholderiales bacterium]|nr:hypothetical protein [Anaerolineae bacterium]
MTDFAPILEAVRQSASLCRVVQQTQIVSGAKVGAEPVTIADYGTQAILCRAISRAFPDDAVIAEEQSAQFTRLFSSEQRAHVAGLVSVALGETVSEADLVRWLDHGQDRKAARTWIIDPIDGTSSFQKLKRYTIAIGFTVDGRAVEGILGAPGHPSGDDLGALFYTADEGRSAYAEPLGGGQARQIRISDTFDLGALTLVQSPGASRGEQDTAGQVRRAAGISVLSYIEWPDSQNKYLTLATGDADLLMYVAYGPSMNFKVWDHAAGVALVEAAGGVVTDLDGSPIDFGQGNTLSGNAGIIAANPYIHGQVLQAVQSVQGITPNTSIPAKPHYI